MFPNQGSKLIQEFLHFLVDNRYSICYSICIVNRAEGEAVDIAKETVWDTGCHKNYSIGIYKSGRTQGIKDRNIETTQPRHRGHSSSRLHELRSPLTNLNAEGYR